MPAMPAATPPSWAAADSDGLVVAPFRGVRFDPKAVPDLAAVTSPPYDVVNAAGARRLEALHPFNVVRLILPRGDAEGRLQRYEHAAATLADWLQSGVLRRDPEPAIYVYDQRDGRHAQRGIIAAVGLRRPEEAVVLPHEDVMPGPVADRLELMRATDAHLEPILLVYDGARDAAELIAAAAAQPPMTEATTTDGVRHRLWSITDPEHLRVIAADLAPRQALIADGHHRHATYLELQAERRRGRGPGGWDFGLALLVNNAEYPLELQSISRVVEGLGLADALASAREVFAARQQCGSLQEGQAQLSTSSGRHPMLLTDGADFVLLSDPDPARVAAIAAATRQDPPFDTSVLHSLLLDQVWKVPDSSSRIRYVHATGNALQAAGETAGTAILLRPVAMSDVLAVAARGARMPRKSTSFGPKPRTGFVLRLLSEQSPGRSQSAGAAASAVG